MDLLYDIDAAQSLQKPIYLFQINLFDHLLFMCVDVVMKVNMSFADKNGEN